MRPTIERRQVADQEALAEVKALANVTAANLQRNGLLVKADRQTYEMAKLLTWIHVNNVAQRCYHQSTEEWVEANLTDRWGLSRRGKWARKLIYQYEQIAPYSRLISAHVHGMRTPEGKVLMAAWNSCYYAVRISAIEKWMEKYEREEQAAVGKVTAIIAETLRQKAIARVEARLIVEVATKSSQQLGRELSDAYRLANGLEPDGRKFYGGKLPPDVWPQWDRAVRHVLQWEAGQDESGHADMEPERVTFTQAIERVAAFINDIGDRTGDINGSETQRTPDEA